MSALSHAPSFPARLLRAYKRMPLGAFVRLVGYNIRLHLTGEIRQFKHVYSTDFDRAYGIDTSGIVALDELNFQGEQNPDFERYEALDPGFFAQALNTCGLTDATDRHLVDIGSGKGKVLFIAALQGFTDITGVELDTGLHEIAARNIPRFARHRPDATIRVANCSGEAYAFPRQPTLCVMNNPFRGAVMTRFIDRLEEQLRDWDEPFDLLYFHCNEAAQFEARPGWTRMGAEDYLNTSHRYTHFRWAG